MTKKNRKRRKIQNTLIINERNIANWSGYWPDLTNASPIIRHSYEFLVKNWEKKKKIDLVPDINKKMSYIFYGYNAL